MQGVRRNFMDMPECAVQKLFVMRCQMHVWRNLVYSQPRNIFVKRDVKLTEPPDAEPHVRWCERSAAKAASYSIAETGGLVLYQNHENHLRMEIAKKAGTESFSCCNVYQRNRNESSRSFTAGRDGTTAENTPAMPWSDGKSMDCVRKWLGMCSRGNQSSSVHNRRGRWFCRMYHRHVCFF